MKIIVRVWNAKKVQYEDTPKTKLKLKENVGQAFSGALPTFNPESDTYFCDGVDVFPTIEEIVIYLTPKGKQ